MEPDTNLRRLSNEQLLLRYQDADGEAFDEFYRRNHLIIFNFLLYKLRNRESAEEVLQETFFKIHHSILSYDSSRNALSWTMTIAKNAAIDLIRKRPKIFNVEEVGELEDSQSTGTEAVLSARQGLDRLLLHLSVDERDLLVSRFLNEESYEEIAHRAGVTPISLRKRFSRLLQKISLQAAKE